MNTRNGAGMGTRTPTPEAREPKSRMSTNSIMPAYVRAQLGQVDYNTQNE